MSRRMGGRRVWESRMAASGSVRNCLVSTGRPGALAVRLEALACYISARQGTSDRTGSFLR